MGRESEPHYDYCVFYLVTRHEQAHEYAEKWF